MNKQSLIWVLIIAVPVGVAALVTGYVYRETGRLPFQEETATSTGPVAEAPSGSEEAAVAETVTPEEDPATAGDAGAVTPSFDVVGVEPTGETVVAGRSDAGAIVALVANGEVVGKSIANESGEWTIILDEPLKPGDYDVGLEVHDQEGTSTASSDERLAVSVPEGGNEQPLVVLNSPDGPSDIIQKPETEEPVVAEAPAAVTAPEETVGSEGPAPEDEKPAAQEPVVVAEAPADQEVPQATETPVAAAPAPQPEQSADAGQPDPQGGQDKPVEPVVTQAPETVPQAETSGTETADATGVQPEGEEETEVAAISPQPDQAAPQTETDVATETNGAVETPITETEVKEISAPAQPVAESGEVPPVTAEPEEAPTVTVEAVESEPDKVFVAGTGEPGSSVRVYVGDDFQGEAQVNAGGKWLVEGDKNVAEGDVEVRADLIAEDGNTVDARAAVTFEKQQEQQIVLTKVVAKGTGGGADGQGADVRRALPVVIIRKGDNLWRISRRLYGNGVRYTTIYQANQDQIRDPDLIYPGQVFLTPEGDLNWPAPQTDTERNG